MRVKSKRQAAVLGLVIGALALLAGALLYHPAEAAPPEQAAGNCFAVPNREIRTVGADGMTIVFSPGVEYRIVTTHGAWTMLVNDIGRTAWVLSSRVTITRCDPMPGISPTPTPQPSLPAAPQPRRRCFIWCW
jgi:hypothetical protein